MKAKFSASAVAFNSEIEPTLALLVTLVYFELSQSMIAPSILDNFTLNLLVKFISDATSIVVFAVAPKEFSVEYSSKASLAKYAFFDILGSATEVLPSISSPFVPLHCISVL